MIRNYLKIALRSLVKQKVYSIINILGLSIGIASCVLIMIYVNNEFSYDRFHKNADQIYKIVLERKYPNHSTNYAVIPHSYADVLATEFPEVTDVVKMGGPFNDVLVSYQTVKNDVKQFEEDFVMAADSNFFEVFSIALLKGDSKKVLLKQSDIVISDGAAKRYFENIDPIGKTLRIFNQDFTVTGISENIPENSHFKFDFLIKWDENFFAGGRQVNFTSFSAHVYLQLKSGTDPSTLEAKFPKMVDTYAAAQIERDLGKSWADYKKEGNGYRYFLQPLTNIHLDPTNIEAKMKPGGNRNYVYFLIAIAVLIIVIACINFMNLATARSAERAREVGVRKTMGSLKSQLVSQFLTESILLSLFSTSIAIGIIYVALPYFNSLAGKSLVFSLSIGVAFILIAIAILVGFLAGSYPAFVLSAFNPVSVMKGTFSSSGKGSWLRNGLVVFQFFISIVLIVGTIVVSKQMLYMQSKSLGYNKERTLVVERALGLGQGDHYKTFVNELSKLSQVEKVGSGFSMLGRANDFFGAQWQAEGSSEILTTKSMVIDDDFASTVGFEFAEGHGYSKETNDSLSVILNESAVKVMGIDDPVGKRLSQVLRRPGQNVVVQFTIVGVIKDFNFQSLRDVITPLTIQSNESFGGAVNYIYVKLKEGEAETAISLIEKKWREFVPAQPFKYEFLDDNLNAQYENEKRAGEIFGVFSMLAIFIACVGLFGLAAYTASLRTKEIGIRKVLGASVSGVVFLLSKDFTKLILIAFVFAVPLGWYVMEKWLQTFAYRIEIDATVFLFAGMLALLVAWTTVSYQSIKAAIVNPVKSLRSE
jgi:putative ABC transport system permease protein